jgi:glycerol-3-phosphate dehydrogenase
VRQISRRELREMEPFLSHAALGAVFVPGEILVEPWMIPLAYAVEVRVHLLFRVWGVRV